MAYYWVTEAQNYIQRSASAPRCGPSTRVAGRPHQPVGRRQLVLLGQEGRPALWQGRRGRRGGRGGHPSRVRPRDPGFAADAVRLRFSVEAGSIGEGFADYWAVTVSNVSRPHRTPLRRRLGLDLLHGGTPHCLRRVDPNLHYPEDLDGAVHTTARSGRARSGTSGRTSARRRPTRSSSRASSA